MCSLQCNNVAKYKAETQWYVHAVKFGMDFMAITSHMLHADKAILLWKIISFIQYFSKYI
jgi:hypothetical protein